MSTINLDEAIAIEEGTRIRYERGSRPLRNHRTTRATGFINWKSQVIYDNGVEPCSESPST